MDTLQRAKVLSCIITLFFGVCSILGFSIGQNIYPQYSYFSKLFGIVFGCYTLLWVQIFYRISNLKPEQIQISNKQCSISMNNLFRCILKSQDFTFQIFFCSTFAIILSYFSISFIFTWEFSRFSDTIYRYYEYPKYQSSPYYQNYHNLANKCNYFLFMVLFSLMFGFYLQIQFIIKLFFKIFDLKDENDNTVVIKLNLKIQDTQLQSDQKSTVQQSIIYICLWISLLIIRLIIYIILSYDYAVERNVQYSFYSGFISLQTVCFILFFIVVLVQLKQILQQIKNNSVELISQNKEYFSSWFTLTSSLIHSNRIKIIGLIFLSLMLTQSIYGFVILHTDDFIFSMPREEYLTENLLIIDILTISIFTGYKFLDIMLKSIFPQSHLPSAKYNFIIQSKLYQAQTVEINDINKQTPETPQSQNGGDKLS